MKPFIADGITPSLSTIDAHLPRLSRMELPFIADGHYYPSSPNSLIRAGFLAKIAFNCQKSSIFTNPFIADGIARLSWMDFHLIHSFRLSRMEVPFITDFSTVFRGFQNRLSRTKTARKANNSAVFQMCNTRAVFNGFLLTF